MKAFYRLLFFISMFVLLTSFAHGAVIFGNKVFHGDVFTSNIGGSFKVYGLDSYNFYNNVTGIMELHYKKIFIMSNVDDQVYINENQCESTHKYKYCYKGSSLDFNNPKTYEGATMLPSISITVESLPNPTSLIVITRNSSIKHYCSEPILVPISIKNAGTIPSDIIYTEKLPANILVSQIVGGTANENTITITGRILENVTKEYSYTLVNLDCKNKSWSATYSFTTFNETLTKNITNLNVQVYDSYNFNDSISKNKTNTFTDEIVYTWNISNTHQSLPLRISTIINTSGLFVTDVSQGISHQGDSYVYTGTIGVGDKLTAYIKFNVLSYGIYTLLNTGTINVNDHQFDYTSNKYLLAIEPTVYVYMDINTTNTSLNINVFAKNNDLAEKYYYIYGVIKGVGEEKVLYANNINPDNTILVGPISYNTTGSGLKNITVIFDGLYRDKDGKEHKLHIEQPVTLNSPKVVTTNVNAVTVVNVTKNVTVVSKPVVTAPKVNNTNNSTAIVKKDIITRMIDGLNSFLQSIFG